MSFYESVFLIAISFVFFFLIIGVPILFVFAFFRIWTRTSRQHKEAAKTIEIMRKLLNVSPTPRPTALRSDRIFRPLELTDSNSQADLREREIDLGFADPAIKSTDRVKLCDDTLPV